MAPFVSHVQLTRTLEIILAGAGCVPEVAREVAEVMAEADMTGHSTHGARQIGLYIERLKAGEVDGGAQPRIAEDAGSVIRIEGHRAFGQIVGSFAARTGAQRAIENGVCLVAISGSGHLGRNGRWPEIAADMGVGSLHFGQGIPGAGPVAPFGGRAGRLNTNPIAMGLPGLPGEHPVVLDCATSAVSGSTIKQLAARGEKVTENLLVSRDGSFARSPAKFVNGEAALAVFGGFKGHAISIFAEILSGIVAAAGKPEKATNALFSVYFSVDQLISPQAYANALAEFKQRIVSCPPIDAQRPVAMPGDRSAAASKRQAESGVRLDLDLAQQLYRAAEVSRKLPEVLVNIPFLRNAVIVG